MAKGWESKGVEEQMEAAREARAADSEERPSFTREEIDRKRKRASMELVLTKIRNDLQNSTEPRHRQMLELALKDMEKKLQDL